MFVQLVNDLMRRHLDALQANAIHRITAIQHEGQVQARLALITSC